MSKLRGGLASIGGTVARNAGNKGVLLGIGMNLGMGSISRMASGDSFGSAMVKEIPPSLLFGIAPGVGWAMMGAGLIGGAVAGSSQTNKTLGLKYKEMHSTSPNFQYADTNQAITMRQAGVQAIQGSKINGRNALGGEARMLHRAYSDRLH